MMDDLRTLLHALAERVASTLEGARASERDEAHHAHAAMALRALAEGDLSPARATVLEGTPEGRDLAEALRRVRELVLAARATLAASGGRMDEARAAAERAAEGVSRQRVALERAGEQVRQLALRASDLATTAGEVRELSERAALLALNAGIEGMRAGGDVARALTALGDELRKLAQRSASGAQQLVEELRALGELARAAGAALEEARVAAGRSVEECTRVAQTAEAARRADAALAIAAARFRAFDDETETLLARLSESAGRLAEDVARARRLAEAGGEASEALRAALARVEDAARGAGHDKEGP